MTTMGKLVSFQATEELIRELDEIAVARGVSRSAVIRWFVHEGLDNSDIISEDR